MATFAIFHLYCSFVHLHVARPFLLTGARVWPLLQFYTSVLQSWNVRPLGLSNCRACQQKWLVGEIAKNHEFMTLSLRKIGLSDVESLLLFVCAPSLVVDAFRMLSGCFSDASRLRFGPSLAGLCPKVAISLEEYSNRSQFLLTGTALATINYRACARKWGLILGCLARNRYFCSFVPPVWSWMDSAIDVGDSFCDRNCDSSCEKL